MSECLSSNVRGGYLAPSLIVKPISGILVAANHRFPALWKDRQEGDSTGECPDPPFPVSHPIGPKGNGNGKPTPALLLEQQKSEKSIYRQSRTCKRTTPSITLKRSPSNTVLTLRSPSIFIVWSKERKNAGSHWMPRQRQNQHKPCRAHESKRAPFHAPIYPADFGLLKEASKPEIRGCAVRRALQFLSRPFGAQTNTSNGGRTNRSRLELGRTASPFGIRWGPTRVRIHHTNNRAVGVSATILG